MAKERKERQMSNDMDEEVKVGTKEQTCGQLCKCMNE